MGDAGASRRDERQRRSPPGLPYADVSENAEFTTSQWRQRQEAEPFSQHSKKILRLHKAKQNLADAVLDGTSSSHAITLDELRELLQ